jgi:DNA-binding MarR family transcriptional regulator
METDFRPTSVVEVQTEYARHLKARRAEYCLFGPIRIADIQAAQKLGGTCLALLFAVHYRRAYTAREAVTLPSGFLAEFGIDKSAKRRGLKRLEEAKFINVKRVAGHSAVVQLTTRARRKARAHGPKSN